MDRGDWRATVHGSQRVRYNLMTITFTFMPLSENIVNLHYHPVKNAKKKKKKSPEVEIQ